MKVSAAASGDLALEPFEADLLLGVLSGEIKTEKLV